MPDDPCRTCLCDAGTAIACAVMQCSKPECDHFQRIEGECCTVKCIQMPNSNSTGVSSFSGMCSLLKNVLYLLLLHRNNLSSKSW